MSDYEPGLSIIIPAYNEEKRLARTLGRIRDYLANHPFGGAETEIIVVDDGSTDGTLHLAQEWVREIPCLRVLSNGKNRGKGYSGAGVWEVD